MSNAFLYAVTVLVWGSTWFAIEFQLGTVAPEVSVVYRYALASGLLFLWCRIRGLPLSFHWRRHLWFVLLGSSLFGINYILAYRAQLYITSALTAIVFSTMLWLNILNARLFFGVRAAPNVIVGALMGVAGIVVLFAPEIDDLSFDDGVLIGSLLAVTSAFIASLGNMVSQRTQLEGLPVLQSNAWGMLYGSLLAAAAASGQGHPFLIDWSAHYLLSLAYLVVFGSIIAFGAYLTLLGRIGAGRAGYAIVMFPVVALILSAAFEGLPITVSVVAGTTLVLAGNLFVLTKRRPELRDSDSKRTCSADQALLGKNAVRR